MVQNGAKSCPKAIPETLQKNIAFLCPFCEKQRPERTRKRTLKSKKTDLGVFFRNKNQRFFWKVIFLFFEASGSSQTLKIELKRCTVVQKRGSHLFEKNCFFFKKLMNNDPLGTPKTFKNAEIHGKMLFEFGGRFLMPKVTTWRGRGERLAAGVGPIGGGGGLASQLCRELCLHV